MKLEKNGWSTTEMLLLSGGLLIALFVSVYFISVLYGSFDNANRNKQYSDLESELAVNARRYVEKNNVNVIDGEKITYQFLQKVGVMDALNDNNGNSCDGYVIVTKNGNLNQYKGYVKCPNYESKNY